MAPDINNKTVLRIVVIILGILLVTATYLGVKSSRKVVIPWQISPDQDLSTFKSFDGKILRYDSHIQKDQMTEINSGFGFSCYKPESDKEDVTESTRPILDIDAIRILQKMKSEEKFISLLEFIPGNPPKYSLYGIILLNCD